MGNFSVAGTADRNRRVLAVFRPWLLTLGSAVEANFARFPSLNAPILRKLLTAPKRYPFRDRLKSMTYRSKAVDLFETQPGVRKEPGSESNLEWTEPL